MKADFFTNDFQQYIINILFSSTATNDALNNRWLRPAFGKFRRSSRARGCVIQYVYVIIFIWSLTLYDDCRVAYSVVNYVPYDVHKKPTNATVVELEYACARIEFTYTTRASIIEQNNRYNRRKRIKDVLSRRLTELDLTLKRVRVARLGAVLPSCCTHVVT